MITVLGLWEHGWMDSARTERRLWKQTIQAFCVTHWAMAPSQDGEFSSPSQYPDLATMLRAYPGPKTFVIPPGRVADSTPLHRYAHPLEGIYVFGNALQSLTRHITPADDSVCVATPAPVDMFAAAVVGIVLCDRMHKAAT